LKACVRSNDIAQYEVVKKPLKPNRPSLPFNPAVRATVEGKRRWALPEQMVEAKKGFRGWHERGYLPHRDIAGLTQFVTFHLADSFPNSLKSEWEHYASIVDNRERRKKLEAYLDRSKGRCHLKLPAIARLVENNFRDFAGERYELLAWAIMPNHVHVLFRPQKASMSVIIGDWKKHTGRLANKLLGRRGPFWSVDYFDIYMRDAAHERRTVRYIENNPTKAGLVLRPDEWPWSSARFRDEFGRLRLGSEREAVTRSDI
jgi:putative transposase